MSGFWERRRQGARAEAEARRAVELAPEAAVAEATPPLEASEAPEARAAREAAEDEATLAALGLKAPEEMAPGDDFAAFMGRAVSARLRRRALRRLWGTRPVLACVDGLNDYDGDYTAKAATPVIRTAYQVGRGLARHVEQLARAEADPAAPSALAGARAGGDMDGGGAAPAEGAAADGAPIDAGLIDAAPAPPSAPPPAPAPALVAEAPAAPAPRVAAPRAVPAPPSGPRRMRFAS